MNFNNPNYPQAPGFSQLQQEYLNLNSRYQNAQKDMEHYRGLYENLKQKTLASFTPLLSNRYNIAQLGGNTPDLRDPIALIDYIITDMIETKKDYIEKINKIVEFKTSAEKHITNFKTEIERLSRLIEEKDSQIDNLNKSLQQTKDERAELRQENIALKKTVETFQKNGIPQEYNLKENKQNEKLKDISEEIVCEKKSNPIKNNENTNKTQLIKENIPGIEEKKSGNPFNLQENSENQKEKEENKISPNKENSSEKKPEAEKKAMNKNSNAMFEDRVKKIPQGQKRRDTPSFLPGVKATPVTQGQIKSKPVEKQEETVTIATGTADKDRENIVSNLVPSEKEFIKIIGMYGISRNIDIQYLYEENPDIKGNLGKGTDNSVLRTIAEKGLVSIEQLKIAGIVYNVYEFTEAGAEVYEILYGEKPVESQKSKVTKQHDNPIHGFLITDTARKLKENYNVSFLTTERKDVSVKVNGGETYIPDIVADITIEKNRRPERCYFEVELGNTPEDAFFKKCNKMRKVTDVFYFLSDTEINLMETQKKLDKWIMRNGGRENMRGLKVCYATYKFIKEGRPLTEIRNIDFK